MKIIKIPSLVKAYAKKQSGRSVTALKTMLPRWGEGSLQHDEILLAIEWCERAEADYEKNKHDETVEASRRNSEGRENWYKRPWGIVALSVLAATVSLIVGAVLKHFYPLWFS